MANKTVDSSIASKSNEIRGLPYAHGIVSEDVIERNYGYKIVRQQVSSGRNSFIYKCETIKHPQCYCIVKAYRLGKEKIRASLKDETCQIMRYVSGKCAQLISTYDIFYTNEKIYLMCDWSPRGEVLANMRNKSIRLNEEMLRNWATDILSAVQFLHNNAICHRNIAPSCLLLTEDLRVKIGTLSDAVVYCKPDGTLLKQKWPKFSRTANWNQPPEVAKSKLYDPRRADIWSVGATLYWFVARTYPIDYRSNTRMTRQLEIKLKLLLKVSTRCQNFIKKLLTYQPSQRPTPAEASELEWVSGVASTSTKSPGSTKAASPAALPEITISGKADPGEAAGPEESSAEPEPSSKANAGSDANGAE